MTEVKRVKSPRLLDEVPRCEDPSCRNTAKQSFNYHALMMKTFLLAFSGLCLMLPTTSAQPAPVAPAANPDKPATARPAQPARNARNTTWGLEAQLVYQVLIGELSARNGETGPAVSIILDAAKKSNDTRLYQRAVDLALESRSGEAALQAASAWKQAQPASMEASRYILQILVTLNRISDSAEPLRSLIESTPVAERGLVFEAVPRLYARASDKKLAANLIEQALAPFFIAPETAFPAWVMAARLRLAAGDSTAAMDAVRRAHGADRKAEGPVLIALDLITPQLPQAEALVRQYLSDFKDAKPEIRLNYARKLLGANRYPDAMNQLEISTRDMPDFAPGWLLLGSLQAQENQPLPAEVSLKRYIALVEKQAPAEEQSAGLAQAFLALAKIAEKRSDFAAAEAWLKRIENPEALMQSQTRRAALLARQGKLKEGIALIRELPEPTREESHGKLLAEVSLLREFKQYAMAYERMAQAITDSPRDVELIYEQAMIAEKLDKLPDMERLLRRVMEIKPDYHAAYNALGYSLADRNVRLPEAKQLIQKALEFAPTDPYIKDSLGWVEFRLGNRTEALRILEAAFKARPDPEIAAHLGEVLWSLGMRERALAIWKEGQLLNIDNETLQETIKRLGAKL